MRKALFILILLMSSVSYGHDYFFAFAEVEYNEMNSKVEVTIRVSTHDFEKSLRSKSLISKDLSVLSQDTNTLSILEKEIEDHFTISSLEQTIDLQLEGFETQKTGIVEFYLSAEVKNNPNQLDIKFDLLMDEFPEQQNKLTFIYRMSKRTLVFMQNKRTQSIDLN